MLNPTQLLGLGVTGVSALWLAITWWRFPSRFWIACLSFFLLVHAEIWYSGRHQLSGLVSSWLQQLGWYSQRQTPQIAASLLLAAGIVVLGCWWLVRNRSRANHLGAGLSIGLLTFLFGLETVSLHAIDAILYQRIASVLLIGWLWAVACIPLWYTLIRHPRPTDVAVRNGD